VKPFSGTPGEWDQLISHLPDPHLLQTWEWSRVKSRFGWSASAAVWDSPGGAGQVAAGMILRRPIAIGRLGSGASMLYCPKGPLADWSDAATRDRLLDDLQQTAAREHAIFVKIDPDVVVATGIPSGLSSDQHEPGKAVMAEFMRRRWRYSAEQVQFRNTVLLQLAFSESALLERMKPKTRYNIRLAQRKGVSVRAGRPDELSMLYNMYAQTSLRDHFAIRDEEYYQTVWNTFMVEPSASENRPWCEPLVAEVEGEVVAAISVFFFARRAYYLYGMSSDRHRDKMPNHLLQWEAIRLAKSRGCEIYDLWGAPDRFDESDRMWGVFRFKEGLGGKVVRTCGAWDFAPSRLQYALFARIAPTVLSALRPLASRRLRQRLGA
jgi:lipid II:glycine glycyltransferase (peptidoglycan interpeptide bridge formation enzyme)